MTTKLVGTGVEFPDATTQTSATNTSATTAELDILDGATLTTAELNYVDGVTSAIQTQLNTKATTANFTSTGIDDNATSTAITIDSSEDVTFTGNINTGSNKNLNLGFNGYVEIDDDRPSITLRANGGQASYGDAIIHANGRYGSVYFKTGIAGSSQPVTTQMTVASAGDVTVNTGNLVIGTNGKGIDFSADADSSATGASTTSELLDDYEEGTWTPTIVGGTMVFTTGRATYTKIGRLVTLNVYVNTTSVSDSTNLLMGGLPFAHQATGYNATGIVQTAIATNTTAIIVRGVAGNTTLDFFYAGSQVHVTQGAASGHLIFTITYDTSS